MSHEELGEITQTQYRTIGELRQRAETRQMDGAERETQQVMFEVMGGVDLCCLRFLKATDYHVEKALQLVMLSPCFLSLAFLVSFCSLVPLWIDEEGKRKEERERERKMNIGKGKIALIHFKYCLR